MKSYRERWSPGGIITADIAALLPIALAVAEVRQEEWSPRFFCLFRWNPSPTISTTNVANEKIISP